MVNLENNFSDFSVQALLPDYLSRQGPCIAVGDINGDGKMDLFVGGRVVPGKYTTAPGSKILINDGQGNFADATTSIVPALQ